MKYIPIVLTLSAGSILHAEPIIVNADNFVRAETDLYMKALANKPNGFGSFNHTRLPAPIDKQSVIRLNRDTLYSSGIFDLKAGPISVTLPNANKRFMSMQVINQDHYTPMVEYKAGTYKLTEQNVGTRYVTVAIRTFIDPTSEKDMKEVHKLQDKITVTQVGGNGKLELPEWDVVSQKRTRDTLLALYNDLPNADGMFGSKDEIQPIRHLIGTAAGWGGNPSRDATYLNIFPSKNDGTTAYIITVPKNIPVDGFWSISVYNKQGYFEKNILNSYTLNNITAKSDQDGNYKIQFGECSKSTVNCLPISEGWNYTVRLYQPQKAILDGSWQFPSAQIK